MADGHITIDTKVDAEGMRSGLSQLASIANKGMTAVAAIIGTGSIALAAFAKQSVEVGMKFEAAMSQVAATMGTTRDEIQDMEQAAKDAGASTMFSATQAAEAMNYLALAGYDAEKSIAALPTVLNLAAAGAMDLGTASDMVTDAMSSLGLETKDLSVFVDQMAKTASKSNTSISQLGNAILTVGGTAKTLKGGTVELNTALGILADNGIKGSEGGTALRNVLLALSGTTDVARGEMEALGLQVYDANGNMRGLSDICYDLNAALSSMTEKDKTQSLIKIFNANDLKSVTALLSTTTDRWNELSGTIADSSGAAQAFADTMNDNLQGAMTEFGSGLEGIQIQIYDCLDESLKTAVKSGIASLNKISASIKSGKLEKSFAKIGDSVEDLAKNMADFADDAIPALIDGIVWLVDNGKALIGTIGTLVLAVKTFEIVNNAGIWFRAAGESLKDFAAKNALATLSAAAMNGELTISQLAYGVLTGQITLATAAQAAFNAICNANPWALLAIGAAAVVTAIGLIIVAANNGESELAKLQEQIQELSEANDDLLDSIEKSAGAYDQSKQDIEKNATAAKSLATKLDTLSKKTNKTVAEKQQMANIVEKLNELVPDLGLAYDAETDSLNKSTDAINNSIDAMKQKAMQSRNLDRYVELQEEAAAIDAQLAEAKSKLNHASTIQNGLEAERATLMENGSRAAGDFAIRTQEANEATRNAWAEVDRLTEAQRQNYAAQAANQQAIEDTALKLTDLSGASDDVADAIDDSTAATERLIAGAYDLTDALADTGLTAEEVADKYQYYADMANDAFSTIDVDAGLSLENLEENLLKNQQIVEEWSNNLGILAQAGLDEGFLQKLRDAGPEASQTVQNLVDHVGKGGSFEELNQIFQKGSEVAVQSMLTEFGLPEVTNSGSKMVDDIKSGVETNDSLEKEAKKLIQDTKSITVSEVTASNFPQVGMNIARGIAQGIADGQSNVINAAVNAVKAALNAAKKEADIHSPSRVWRDEIGAQMVAGMGAGFTQRMPYVIEDMLSAVSYMQRRIGDQAVALTAPPSYLGDTDNSSSVTIGDLYITVSGSADESTARGIGSSVGEEIAMQLRYRGVLR